MQGRDVYFPEVNTFHPHTTKFQSGCGICKKWHLEILCEGKSVPKPKSNKLPLQEKENKKKIKRKRKL